MIKAKERIKWGRGEGAVREVEILKTDGWRKPHWGCDTSVKAAEGEGASPEDLREEWAEQGSEAGAGKMWAQGSQNTVGRDGGRWGRHKRGPRVDQENNVT